MKVIHEVSQFFKGSSKEEIIHRGQPLTKAPAYLTVMSVKVLGSATAKYRTGIASDLEALLGEPGDEPQGCPDG